MTRSSRKVMNRSSHWTWVVCVESSTFCVEFSVFWVLNWILYSCWFSLEFFDSFMFVSLSLSFLLGEDL
jgi:hypothetical protein